MRRVLERERGSASTALAAWLTLGGTVGGLGGSVRLAMISARLMTRGSPCSGASPADLPWWLEAVTRSAICSGLGLGLGQGQGRGVPCPRQWVQPLSHLPRHPRL